MSRRIPSRVARELAAIAPGWVATLTKGGHIRLTHPSGGIIHTAFTPSDWRARRNLASQVRRYERGL